MVQVKELEEINTNESVINQQKDFYNEEEEEK